MTRDRLIQLIAAAVCLVGATGAGALLPSLLEDQERYALRYTDDVAEGAPPFVAFATSIGALRGVLVNYLWIKINTMKEKGQFYEVMADADLLTKLQPRFPTVWTFHGHNMAYNISVATHTPEERWEWVRSGIRLVQKEGLKYNPNDLLLHRELAFWYAHKIDGYADDAHLHYKREFCREWHYVLGPPPPNYEDRIAWIKAVADAPESLQEAEERSPGVLALVERLKSDLSPFQRRTEFELDARFLRDYGQWKAITEQSMVAELLGYAERARRDNEFFRAFDELAADPARAEAWQTLLQHVRKKVLREEYNMDPQRMYEYTRDLGPIDWRHAQGHALYWARRGAEVAESRVANEDGVYKIVNNDRMQLQAMQALAREGRIRFDPFSEELPNRYMEPRWIDTIDQQFEHFWKKHEHTRGAGGDTFIGFLENFMRFAIRFSYQAGEIEKAQSIMDRMDRLFGQQAGRPDNFYNRPLDVFVREQLQGELTNQPYLAANEIYAALRNGFRLGIGRRDEARYRHAVEYAKWVGDYVRQSEEYGYTNQFGESRLASYVGNFLDNHEEIFDVVITDGTLDLFERMTIWRYADEMTVDPELRAKVYRDVIPAIEQELASLPIGQRFSAEELFPPPPNLEAYERRIALERERREREMAEQRDRPEITRQENRVND